MTAQEIAALTRLYINDPDQVLLSQANLAQFLSSYYNGPYRMTVDPEVFERSYTTTLSNTLDLNLLGTLFSNNTVTATEPVCQRITRVLVRNQPGAQPLYLLRPATSYETLKQYAYNGFPYNGLWPQSYWLDGTILRFSTPITATIDIVYLPQATINWQTAIQPGAPVFVDNLEQFHDVIALGAAKAYYIANGFPNPVLFQEYESRYNDMKAFFVESRSGKASRQVQTDGWYNGSNNW